jgi:hypothetical protein
MLLLANATGTEGSALLLIAGIAFVGYFLPTIIAFWRKKGNKVPILLLNFFLGWSLIGWVVSLVWACSQEPKPVIVQQTFHSTGGGFVPDGGYVVGERSENI